LDIGKYDRYIGGVLQKLDRMIRIDGLYDFEAQLTHHLSRAQTNEKLVLDYQNKEFVSHEWGTLLLRLTGNGLRLVLFRERFISSGRWALEPSCSLNLGTLVLPEYSSMLADLSADVAACEAEKSCGYCSPGGACCFGSIESAHDYPLTS